MAKGKRKSAKRSVKKSSKKRMSHVELSKSRGHVPVHVLKGYLAKMPRHMHELATLIKQRQKTGE